MAARTGARVRRRNARARLYRAGDRRHAGLQPRPQRADRHASRHTRKRHRRGRRQPGNAERGGHLHPRRQPLPEPVSHRRRRRHQPGRPGQQEPQLHRRSQQPASLFSGHCAAGRSARLRQQHSGRVWRIQRRRGGCAPAPAVGRKPREAGLSLERLEPDTAEDRARQRRRLAAGHPGFHAVLAQALPYRVRRHRARRTRRPGAGPVTAHFPDRTLAPGRGGPPGPSRARRLPGPRRQPAGQVQPAPGCRHDHGPEPEVRRSARTSGEQFLPRYGLAQSARRAGRGLEYRTYLARRQAVGAIGMGPVRQPPQLCPYRIRAARLRRRSARIRQRRIWQGRKGPAQPDAGHAARPGAHPDRPGQPCLLCGLAGRAHRRALQALQPVVLVPGRAPGGRHRKTLQQGPPPAGLGYARLHQAGAVCVG
ncbi:Uncharacterised protein [Bordetella pertussis]|nr:Uncharacterised protein [Bordetella pertussis]